MSDTEPTQVDDPPACNYSHVLHVPEHSFRSDARDKPSISIGHAVNLLRNVDHAAPPSGSEAIDGLGSMKS